MKIIALDIGDAWTGIALSDTLRFFAHPYKTVATKDLVLCLQMLIQNQSINTIIVGYPQTMRATESEQTKKVVTYKEKIAQELPSTITWIWWDERLSSKQAAQVKKIKTKEDKLQSHAIAAALILESYLTHLQLTSSHDE